MSFQELLGIIFTASGAVALILVAVIGSIMENFWLIIGGIYSFVGFGFCLIIIATGFNNMSEKRMLKSLKAVTEEAIVISCVVKNYSQIDSIISYIYRTTVQTGGGNILYDVKKNIKYEGGQKVMIKYLPKGKNVCVIVD